MNLNKHTFLGFCQRRKLILHVFLPVGSDLMLHPELFWEACLNQSFVSSYSQKKCNLLLPMCIGVPEKQRISILFTNLAFQILVSSKYVIVLGYIFRLHTD